VYKQSDDTTIKNPPSSDAKNSPRVSAKPHRLIVNSGTNITAASAKR